MHCEPRAAFCRTTKQAQVGAIIQRTGEVSMTKLDVDQQRNVRDAMTREIQSWLEYHAVNAARHSGT